VEIQSGQQQLDSKHGSIMLSPGNKPCQLPWIKVGFIESVNSTEQHPGSTGAARIPDMSKIEQLYIA
jgi:hypothetical protein